MKHDLYQEAKDELGGRLEFRGDQVPTSRFGWWIKLHFSDDGQLAIAEVKEDAYKQSRANHPAASAEHQGHDAFMVSSRATVPEQPPVPVPDQLQLPLSPQPGDQ